MCIGVFLSRSLLPGRLFADWPLSQCPVPRAARCAPPSMLYDCTAHCTLHTTHYTLYTTHYILHTTHYTLHTTHYKLYTTHYTLHTIHYKVHTTHYSQYTLHTTYCTLALLILYFNIYLGNLNTKLFKGYLFCFKLLIKISEIYTFWIIYVSHIWRIGIWPTWKLVCTTAGKSRET